jgi:glycerate kinase
MDCWDYDVVSNFKFILRNRKSPVFMKVLIAPDKFKHSLSTFQAIEAIQKGLQQSSDSFQLSGLPLADGGDDFAEVMGYYTSAQRIMVEVADPLFRPIQASYFISGRTAFIEMAKASGLQLLKPGAYNCMLTSSYGTGLMIAHALSHGVDEIILGIGGSATNDCGIGMAAALGYRFLDEEGKEVTPTGGNLIHIYSIEAPPKNVMHQKKFVIASDVTNYLTGDFGAAKVFAPQKGATPKMVQSLEEGTLHLAKVVQRDLGVNILNIKGGGAAGGMGAGSVAFFGAMLVNGAELVFNYSQAETQIREADVVITGEGKIDKPSLQDKLLYGISGLCQKHNKPLIALCGMLDVTPKQLEEAGVTAAFSIINKPLSIEESYKNAAVLLEQTAYYVGKMMKGI